MKKIIATGLSLLMSFSLFACSKDTQTSGNNENNNSNTEMAWTVKTATYTYPTGMSIKSYTAELNGSTFTMNDLRELREGEVDRNSMILEFESDILEKVRYESQDYGEDVVQGEEFSLSYDDATSTLTRTTTENGELYSTKIYNITWDTEGRIAEYELNTKYYQSDDNSEYNSKYIYSYGADSYTITLDKIYTGSIDGLDEVELIRRTTTTVPYDEKGDITTVTSYFQKDGTTQVAIGYNEVKTLEERITSNRWGYVTSDTVHYSDGSSKDCLGTGYTFDAEGKIIKKVSEIPKNDMVAVLPDGEQEMVTETIEFTYDANGNLTKIERNYDGEISTLTFEWMQIPAKLDGQIAMLSGSPHWSVTEYIDNYVDFNYDGRLTVRTYTKEAFLSYIQ